MPPFLQRIFRGAREINPADHLAMQIALQAEIDNAISKTINLPSATSLEAIEDIYLQAYLGKLKGITIFREESRPGVIEVGQGREGDKAPGQDALPDIEPTALTYKRGRNTAASPADRGHHPASGHRLRQALPDGQLRPGKRRSDRDLRHHRLQRGLPGLHRIHLPAGQHGHPGGGGHPPKSWSS